MKKKRLRNYTMKYYGSMGEVVSTQSKSLSHLRGMLKGRGFSFISLENERGVSLSL